MLGLGSSIIHPSALDSGYVNSHSFSLDGTGDYVNANTTMQPVLNLSLIHI